MTFRVIAGLLLCLSFLICTSSCSKYLLCVRYHAYCQMKALKSICLPVWQFNPSFSSLVCSSSYLQMAGPKTTGPLVQLSVCLYKQTNKLYRPASLYAAHAQQLLSSYVVVTISLQFSITSTTSSVGGGIGEEGTQPIGQCRQYTV